MSKSLILDDDIHQGELLHHYLKKYCSSITETYLASTIEEALDIYFQHTPDILFLDVQLTNGTTGFDFLEKINVQKSEIIFVTSYDEYALKAIEVEARGYILKPIQVDKLVSTVNKAISNLKKKEKEQPSTTRNVIDFIAIPSIDKIEIIKKKEIVYLEADGRYTLFHLLDGSKKLASRNLGEYERQLDEKMFFRIHHSYIVNLHMVRNINKSGGNYCELISKKLLPISKRKQEKLNRFLNIK